jgi:hypothetical protein
MHACARAPAGVCEWGLCVLTDLHISALTAARFSQNNSSLLKQEKKQKKKIWAELESCMSSLRRGHANLLICARAMLVCIVPISSDALLRVPGSWSGLEASYHQYY